MKSYQHFQEFGGGLLCLLRFREAWKYLCWSWMDSEQVLCFYHSWDQNEEPLLLGQVSVGQLTCIMLIRPEIYRMIYNELYLWWTLSTYVVNVAPITSIIKLVYKFHIVKLITTFNIFLVKNWYLGLNLRAFRIAVGWVWGHHCN